MSCSTNLCEVMKIPITVGGHKQTDLAKPVRQDGFVAAILLLVYFGGLIIALIMARYLSQENVVVSKVDPYVVEIVLIILLLPGFFVIIYAFFCREHARVVRHRQDNVASHLHEVIAEAGLYIFATCSIAFDIVVLSSEIDCMGMHDQVSSTTDGVVDCIFYFSKILFTVAQCLFMRKFHHSRFDSNPILQVFLVSIITSNLAIWVYTIIDDDSAALFDQRNVDEGSMQDFVCGDKTLLENKTRLQPYFAPFTLEFSLLVFERIINIWSKMVDLELIDNVNRDITIRALFNNKELQKIEHDLNEKRQAYKEMHHQAETSQARLTTWMSNLYERLRLNYTGHVRQMVDQIYGYGEKVYNLIDELNKAIDDGGYVIKQVQELRKLNTYHLHIEQALNSGPGAALLVLLNGHNYGVNTKREEIQQGLDTKMAELDIASGRVTQLSMEIKQERDRLPRDRPTGYSCGLCCVFALVISVASFAIGVIVVFITPKGLDITSWLANNSLPANSSENRGNFITFSDIVNLLLLSTNLITYAVIFAGFWKLLTFKSNYRMFRFTDVFYCLSCFGSVLLLSFSAIAACAVRPNTTVKEWEALTSEEYNITAGNTLSLMSNYSLVFILSQFLQIFLSSVFVIHANQMLPHGVPRINKPVREVIQFVGMVHFFLWVLNSFIYGPNQELFYPVEMFYYGSNFEILARITFPILIFYHFTTALRCLDLSIKYDSMP